MTTASASTKSSRFWTLDAVRGLAVLAVVCFHVLPRLDADAYLSDPSIVWVSWLRYGGLLGVSIFFVLSGFSIHLSQARKLTAKENTHLSWSKFFHRRFWRLYPAYLSAIVYLLHQIFVPYIKSAIELNTFNAVSLLLTLGLVLAITLPLAECFHRWVELPFSRFEQRL